MHGIQFFKIYSKGIVIHVINLIIILYEIAQLGGATVVLLVYHQNFCLNY